MYASTVEYGVINREALTEKQVRIAYILKLPFRLRIGPFFRIQVDIGGPAIICARNRIDVPQGSQTTFADSQDKEYLSTELMLVDLSPDMPDWALEQLRKWDGKANSEPGTGVIDDPRIVNVLNQFIVAYGRIIEGPSTVNLVLPLTLADLHSMIEWRIVLLCPENYSLTDEELLALFDRPHHQGFKLRSFEAFYKLEHLDDADPSSISQLSQALDRQQDFIFYEFAFLAKSRIFQRDPSGGLLMAVIALEGAHAALVRNVLIPKFSSYGSKEAITKAEDFLRELGMSNLNLMSPFLFMGDGERPSVDQIKSCAKGITLRNQLMHALTDKAGRYRVRQHGYQELTDACSAVLEVYEYYVKALESRVTSPSQPGQQDINERGSSAELGHAEGESSDTQARL